VLIATRLEFLSNPAGSESIQGVAAFASLHVSVTFAAALFMMRTNQGRLLRTITWVFFGVTILATLYFGWHYILDDIAGMGIGWAAVTVAGSPTGHRRRRTLQPPDPVIASDTEAAVTSEEDATAEVTDVSEANVSALEAEKRTLVDATELSPEAEPSPPQPPVRRTA